MPIYMDRHEVPESFTEEDAALLHQQDLKVQHEFNCRPINYFFDKKRNKAFCLYDAPDQETMLAMHKYSHGQMPNKVIEVEEQLFESFLGRIEHPEKEHSTDLYINNDPPSRTIMVISINRSSLEISVSENLNKSLQNYNKSVIKTLNSFEGSIVKQKADSFLVSFISASKAVSCALNIQSGFNVLIDKHDTTNIHLKIGINSGIPVTDKEKLFESTIKLADRMCNMVKEKIVVSFEVKNLYKSENLNVIFDDELVHTLNPSDEKFLTLVMDYIEETWNNSNLRVDDFGKQLGHSKSQLYRKMISLTGKSPNTLIKEYRLSKALKLFNEQKGNISEIAYETGFNSPAYFSKCFLEIYGILPSAYTKQSVSYS